MVELGWQGLNSGTQDLPLQSIPTDRSCGIIRPQVTNFVDPKGKRAEYPYPQGFQGRSEGEFQTYNGALLRQTKANPIARTVIVDGKTRAELVANVQANMLGQLNAERAGRR